MRFSLWTCPGARRRQHGGPSFLHGLRGAGCNLEGEKVLLFLAAANRDPRRWERPDVFDISRRAAGHMTFGTGIHGCVGQSVARLETEAILAALANRVESLELIAEPRRRLNNTLRGFDTLPLRITAVS